MVGSHKPTCIFKRITYPLNIWLPNEYSVTCLTFIPNSHPMMVPYNNILAVKAHIKHYTFAIVGCNNLVLLMVLTMYVYVTCSIFGIDSPKYTATTDKFLRKKLESMHTHSLPGFL